MRRRVCFFVYIMMPSRKTIYYLVCDVSSGSEGGLCFGVKFLFAINMIRREVLLLYFALFTYFEVLAVCRVICLSSCCCSREGQQGGVLAFLCRVSSTD